MAKRSTNFTGRGTHSPRPASDERYCPRCRRLNWLRNGITCTGCGTALVPLDISLHRYTVYDAAGRCRMHTDNRSERHIRATLAFPTGRLWLHDHRMDTTQELATLAEAR